MVAVVFFVLHFFLWGWVGSPSPFPSIHFLGHNLSDFTPRDLPVLLSLAERNWFNEPLELIIDDKRFLLAKKDLHLSWDTRALRRLIKQAEANDIISPVIQYNEEKMHTQLQNIANYTYISPQDAYLEKGIVHPSLPGRALDIEKATHILHNALSEGQSRVELDCFQTFSPNIETADLMVDLGFPHLLGSHTTCLQSRDEETLFNISKACSSVHGVVLEAGSIFSFNQEVGPAEKEDGYLETRIVVNGRLVPGYGGGICQVSSTLYNTVLKSGGEVVERHPHSGYSETTSYVLPGLDAAVSYGHLDMRFRFPHQRVVILAYISGDTLTTEIWGEKEETLQRDLSTKYVDFRDQGNGEGMLEVRTTSLIRGEMEFEHRDVYRIPSDFALTLIEKKEME